MSEEVEKLVSEGRYADAAKAASDAGDHAHAASLYEKIWDFKSASLSAQSAGDIRGAIANALRGKDSRRARELYAAIAKEDAATEALLDVFVEYKHFDLAAQVALASEKKAEAAKHYQAAGMPTEAAKLLIELGELAEAGRLLERNIAHREESKERAEMSLLLGEVLAELSRLEDSIPHFQAAIHSGETAVRATRKLTEVFSLLGMMQAARDSHQKLRELAPETPRNLDDFLRQLPRRESKPQGAQAKGTLVGGRYRIGELLGTGASGRVHRAKDEVSGKEVAVKILSTQHSHGSDEFLRFDREASLARTLRHPNLVEVYQVSSDQGFLVMECMDGSLEARIESQGSVPLATNIVRAIALDVLAGLERAHSRGVIHRDIKPANIFLDSRGVAKIGDFGVAHLLDLGQTQTGGLIGTLAYMSPEQITGAPLTIGADLYGLGITLFEALTGRLPFQGPDFVAQHLGETAPLASQSGCSDPQWDPILARLLAKSPAERYESIPALRKDLRGIVVEEERRALVLGKSDKMRAANTGASTTGEAPALSASSSTSLLAVTESVADSADESRYQFESTLGSTERSSIRRAVDRSLNRSVILEQFSEPLLAEEEARLYVLARGGGPFLQRVLSYDREAALVVYEAPTGSPMGEREEPLSPRLAIRVVKRLARAIAPLHATDSAHGDISPATLLLDHRGHPTILIAGNQSFQGAPEAVDDVRGILLALALAVREPSGELTPRQYLLEAVLGPQWETQAPELDADKPLGNGDELYEFADRVEMILLRDRQERERSKVRRHRWKSSEEPNAGLPSEQESDPQ